jgi:hypothetical protein
VSALVPPPRKRVVRYYEALGPRSLLMGAVTAATRGRATLGDLESWYSVTIAGKAARKVVQAASAAKRAWAACMRKIFEVYPVRCESADPGTRRTSVPHRQELVNLVIAKSFRQPARMSAVRG